MSLSDTPASPIPSTVRNTAAQILLVDTVSTILQSVRSWLPVCLFLQRYEKNKEERKKKPALLFKRKFLYDK